MLLLTKLLKKNVLGCVIRHVHRLGGRKYKAVNHKGTILIQKMDMGIN